MRTSTLRGRGLARDLARSPAGAAAVLTCQLRGARVPILPSALGLPLCLCRGVTVPTLRCQCRGNGTEWVMRFKAGAKQRLGEHGTVLMSVL
ncbi:hypothetical protein ANANG_G00196150 [Anguilla anguilla]|uniref:Uncharacterized protein n=1 Tax=Anguilla anguilla TaxID=7936 RepID=A0A9D3M5H5_ANGAN|nr:hypothetical protein ANANG_G00196150 [Anguilla anguilla]